MLSVCKQHTLRLSDYEVPRLCTALCLPNMKKDDFLQYWAHFSQDVSSLKKYVPNLFNNSMTNERISSDSTD